MATQFRPLGLCFSALIVCSGCELFVSGSEECKDKACDQARWLILDLDRRRVGVETNDSNCFEGYQVDYVKPQASQGFIIPTSFSVRRSDLRIAITTNDGVLHLSEFGQPAADLELPDQHALAVAWSPAGDRLALLVGDPQRAPLDLELLVLTGALQMLDSIPLRDKPGFEALPPRYHLSWSPDAVWVAVTSTEDTDGRLVNLNTAETVALTARNAAFLSNRALVVEVGEPGAPRLERVELDEREITSRASLRIHEELLDADAQTGVLLTVVQSGISYWRSLRTTDLGPNSLGSVGGGEYQLIPLTDEVEQVLAASDDLLRCAE